MKKFARIICVMLSAVLCISLAACPSDGPNPDDNVNETSSLVFSVQELDNVFNPYFSTSGYDSEIVGNTQVGMLTSDRDGQVYCGPQQPTVAMDYSQIITYDGVEYNPNSKDPNAVKTPDLGDNKPEDISAEDYYTTYRFLIKNGIKFSDGQELTIKDVLFNLYTFLDPAYSGSSTIYSTAIKGMNAYRTQTPDADANTSSQLNRTMQANAEARLKEIRNAFHTNDETRNVQREYFDSNPEEKKAMLADAAKVRLLFWDEINNDWKNADAQANADKLDEDLGFTEAWEFFLYNEGIISVTFDSNGKVKRYDHDDPAGLYKKGDKMIEYGDTKSWNHDKDDLIARVYNTFIGVLPVDQRVVNGKNVTDLVIDERGKAVKSKLEEQGLDAYYNAIYNSSNCISNMFNIVTYWGTRGTATDDFVAEEKSKYFAKQGTGIDTISGITVEKLTAGSKFVGVNGEHEITEDQYVLQIQIERVDPKAIWNFGFTVAPMHYYSNAENSDTYRANGASVDYRSFNYPGVDGYDSSKDISVGRPFGDKTYFDEVLKASNIISLPMGAGIYKASNVGAGTAASFKEFCDDNIVYFTRNDYFYTTSGEKATPENSSICNAKIKNVRYKIISATKLLDSIINGEVHYGDPSATAQNVATVNANSKLGKVDVWNNGHGYIGINATYVPDLNVRKAIMYAMDTTLISSYYPANTAELIFRPMSTCSWAYPKSATKPYYYPEDLEYTGGSQGDTFDNKVGDIIETLMTSGAYRYSGFNGKTGVWQRTLDDGTTHRCKYTFTIAGATDDHPAFTTMKKAAEILNKHGFDVTVKTDAQALSKLAAGKLTVWAAAWSSTIDPDMYQVYHMDSAATSVKNWGYPDILNGTERTYKEQKAIVQELSDKITEARSMLDQNERAAIYEEALDLVMDLAVELPTYQRKNLYVYRNDIIDTNTLNLAATPYSGPLARMWEVSMVGGK